MSSSVLLFVIAAQTTIFSRAGLSALPATSTTMPNSCHDTSKTSKCPSDSSTTGHSMVQMRRAVTKATLISTNNEDVLPKHPGKLHSDVRLVDDKFELCKPSRAQSNHDMQAVQSSVQEHTNACNKNQLVLWEQSNNARRSTCCPVDALWCAGCAKSNSKMTACEVCMGGYASINGGCVACADTPGWVNEASQSCQQISASQCTNKKNRGLSPKEACCHCGGGQQQASEFLYKVMPLVLGSTVVQGWPMPRTASQYLVDSSCGLAQFGLTIDSATGKLGLAPGCQSIGCWNDKEPFQVTCTLTARQSATLNASTNLMVNAGYFGYNDDIIFISSASSQFKLQQASNLRAPFTKVCLPKGIDSWLKINAADGTLTTSSSATEDLPEITSNYIQGGVTGGVCRVAATAFTAEGFQEGFQNRSITLVVLAPRPWLGMSFGVRRLFATVGETSPDVAPIRDSGGQIPPRRFSVDCIHRGFSFDALTGAAKIDGHLAFTLDVITGRLRVVPSKHLLTSLETEIADLNRAHAILPCIVYGHYEWRPFTEEQTTIKASIEIDIREDSCWTTVTASFAAENSSTVSEAACRSSCRNSKTCTHFSWQSGTCKILSARCRAEDNRCITANLPITAQEKIPNCGERTSCISVAIPGHWYLGGHYCPLGDNGAAGPIYFKTGITTEDSYYLAQYDENRDTDILDCSAGHAVLKKVAPSHDFDDPKSSYMELHGGTVACLKGAAVLDKAFTTNSQTVKVRVKNGATDVDGIGILQLAGLSCTTPNTTFTRDGDSEEEEKEELEVKPLVLDDPTTTEPDDHWLHPCQCFPMSWGPEPPVEQASYVKVPPRSGNRFVPNKVDLVQGELVCETGSLVGIHTELEQEAVEVSDCELLCRRHKLCNFFWHGEVLATVQCRLYHQCRDLVREPGAVGNLAALADRAKTLCRIANPEVCWKVSKRREFLGAQVVNNPPFGQCEYEDIVQQCDHKLLIGGVGVEKCARCEYAEADTLPEHAWSHKRPPHKRYEHGQQVGASCWSERFSTFPSSGAGLLTCVSGRWLGPAGLMGLSGFTCEACIQVVNSKYADLDLQDVQELFFVDRQEVVIFADGRHRIFLDNNLVTKAHEHTSTSLAEAGENTKLKGFLVNVLYSEYLDVRGGGCEGNQYCVSAASNTDWDSTWEIVKIEGRGLIQSGDLVHVKNARTSFLDVSGGGCEHNFLCVSASAQANRYKNSGTWRIIKRDSAGEIGDGDVVFVQNSMYGVWLERRGTGCEGNAGCVSGRREQYGWKSSTMWKIVLPKTWFYLDHAAGTPVQCGGPNKIQCASSDGVSCRWGQFPKHMNYDQVAGVDSRLPVEVNCPGWATRDGTDPCKHLGCYKKMSPSPQPTPAPTEQSMHVTASGEEKTGDVTTHITGCYAISEYNADFKCNRAYDGNPNTDFASYQKVVNPWIKLDLDSVYVITQFEFVQRSSVAERTPQLVISGNWLGHETIDTSGNQTVKHVLSSKVIGHQIRFQAPGTPQNWGAKEIKLVGYEQGFPRRVLLSNSWQAYQEGHQRPTYTVNDGICLVSGLVKFGKRPRVATLPPDCRPDGRLIFNSVYDETPVPLEVSPDGRVDCYSGQEIVWLSLTGIVLTTSAASGARQPLELVNGWVPYGHPYSHPTYTVRGGLCVLEGTMKNGAWQQIAQLPPTCRPSHNSLFITNNYGGTARIDIFTDGKVYWKAGSKQVWISLSGISFAVGNTNSQNLTMTSGWVVPHHSWHAPTISLSGGLCFIEGFLVRGRSGKLADLPMPCRPEARLVFGVHKENSLTRVDILPDGQIIWMSFQSNRWLSLDGIVFKPTKLLHKHAWYLLDYSEGVPVQCGQPNRLKCDSIDGEDCNWVRPSNPYNPYARIDGVAQISSFNTSIEFDCPAFPSKRGASDACAVLSCYEGCDTPGYVSFSAAQQQFAASDLMLAGAFTVEAYIRRSGLYATQWQSIVNNGVGGGCAEATLWITPWGALRGSRWATGVPHCKFGSGNPYVDSKETIAPNTWVHVVGVFDVDSITLFINGTQAGSTKVAGGAPHSYTTGFTVGSFRRNLYFFDGSMISVRIWSRVLTRSEISDLYGFRDDCKKNIQTLGVNNSLHVDLQASWGVNPADIACHRGYWPDLSIQGTVYNAKLQQGASCKALPTKAPTPPPTPAPTVVEQYRSSPEQALRFIAKTLSSVSDETKQFRLVNNFSKCLEDSQRMAVTKGGLHLVDCVNDGTRLQQRITADEMPSLLTDTIETILHPRMSNLYSGSERFMGLGDVRYDFDCGDGALSSLSLFASGSYPLTGSCTKAALPSFPGAEFNVFMNYTGADRLVLKSGGKSECLTASVDTWFNNFPGIRMAECDDSTEQHWYFGANNRLMSDSKVAALQGKCAGTEGTSPTHLVLKDCSVTPGFALNQDGILSIVARTDQCVNRQSSGQLVVGRCSQGPQLWSRGRGFATLSQAPLECPQGTVIKRVEKDSRGFNVTCAYVVGLGECVWQRTNQVTISEADTKTLEALTVAGMPRHALKSIVPEVSTGGRWVRIQYMYCAILIPSAVQPTGRLIALGANPMEGIYCPAQKDRTGRPVFAQSTSFSGAANSSMRLAFNNLQGKWCINDECADSHALHPLQEYRLEPPNRAWTVRPVSDFDGTFEARGPGKGGATATKKKGTTKPKPPKLIKFEEIKPEYAEECKDDVFYDKEKMNKVGVELPSENPCSLVAGDLSTGQGAVYPKWKSLSEYEETKGFTWKQALGCLKRMKVRDLQKAHISFWTQRGGDFVKEVGGLADFICGFLPDTNIEPFGLGVSMKQGAMCKGITKIVQSQMETMFKTVRETSDFQHMRASVGDCRLNGAFARIFCDLHCIRNAVKQGDVAILDSIKNSFEVMTQNNQMLFEHYTQTVLDKMDTMKPKKASLEQISKMKDGIHRMFADMHQMASKSTFDIPSKASILRALNKLSAISSQASPGNITGHFMDLLKMTSNVQSLLDTAKDESLFGAAAVAHRVGEVAGHMLEVSKQRNHMLGVFNQAASISKQRQEWLWQRATRKPHDDDAFELDRMGTQNVLLTLDKTWWSIRTVIDRYLDAAETQAKKFTDLVTVMDAYTSKCSASYLSLSQAYSQAVRAEKHAHKVLRKVWGKSVPLVGLLASQLCDADAFSRFARADVAAAKGQATGHNANESQPLSMFGMQLRPDHICANNSAVHTDVQSGVSRTLAEGLFGQMVAQLDVLFHEMDMMEGGHADMNIGSPINIKQVLDAKHRVQSCLASTTNSLSGYAQEVLQELRLHAKC